jgi:hypothetical protein
MGSTHGERLAEAIVARDAATLHELLAPEVDFRAMTPRRFWEATSPDEIVDKVILGAWFTPADGVETLELVETGAVADRQKVTYRFGGTNGDGPYVVEQQAYYELDGDRITWLRVMCSGYLPT